MAVSSFSANKLTNLISKLSGSTIGVKILRYDVMPHAREMISQAGDESKKILAYVLWTKCLSICDYYDGEPMLLDTSQGIMRHLKGIVLDALKLLAYDAVDKNKAIAIAAMIIAIDIKKDNAFIS